jgi:alpha/beta superfamily hydrolase
MPARSLTLHASDGIRLEAELDLPEEATAVAVLAHPHPLYGGSMDAGLVDELFRRLPARGVGALRFNFRGVGGSTGQHDEGRAERLDVAAALAGADAAAGGRPIFLCGWSFGADVSFAVADAAHRGWVAVAPPLRVVPPSEMAAPGDARPKLLLVPEHDQFRPPDAAREVVASWTATSVEVLAGADHFVWGHAAEVAEQVIAFGRHRA